MCEVYRNGLLIPIISHYHVALFIPVFHSAPCPSPFPWDSDGNMWNGNFHSWCRTLVCWTYCLWRIVTCKVYASHSVGLRQMISEFAGGAGGGGAGGGGGSASAAAGELWRILPFYHFHMSCFAWRRIVFSAIDKTIKDCNYRSIAIWGRQSLKSFSALITRFIMHRSTKFQQIRARLSYWWFNNFSPSVYKRHPSPGQSCVC